jgi:hypothetical protein
MTGELRKLETWHNATIYQSIGHNIIKSLDLHIWVFIFSAPTHVKHAPSFSMEILLEPLDLEDKALATCETSENTWPTIVSLPKILRFPKH